MNAKKSKTALGQLLKHYRKNRGLTPTELVTRLDNGGYPISLSVFNKIESGERRPPIQFITLFAEKTELNQGQLRALLDANIVDTFQEQYDEVLGLKIKIPRLFISYSSKDERIVLRIADSLEKAGFEYWLDKKDILIGQPILDRLREGIISESDYTLIILSANSVISEWCRFELRMAYEKEMSLRRIVALPIRVDQAEVPMEVRTKKYYQLDPRSKASMNSLVSEIKSLVDSQVK